MKVAKAIQASSMANKVPFHNLRGSQRYSSTRYLQFMKLCVYVGSLMFKIFESKKLK